MLSLPDNQFASLGDAFKAQEQQAAESKLLTDEQYKLLNGLMDNSDSLAVQRAALGQNAPQLTTQISAQTMPEGIMKGIAAGIGNAQQLRQFNRQQQGYQDIAQAIQQSQAQRMQLAQQQIAADQARRQGAAQVLPAGLRPIYGVLDPAGQNTFLGNVGTKEIGIGYKPAEGTAEGQAQVNKGTAINTGIQALGPMERSGIPIPGQLNAARNIQGSVPLTTVDVNKDILATRQAAAGLQESQMRNSVLPTQLQQDIEKNKLDIAIKQVDAQFAEQEKQLAIKKDQLANQQGTLDYQKGMQEYKRFQQGQMLFKQLQDSGALESNDPAKQATMQAQLGIYGVKYNPPSSSFQTVKRKDGTMYMLDKNTGKIGKLEKDGTVKEWQDLQL